MKSHAKTILATMVWMLAALTVHADSMLEIEATQRYPWNGLVHLECHVPNPDGASVQSFTVADMAHGTNFAARTLLSPSGEPVEEGFFLPSGDSFIVWNAAADLPKSWRSERLAVTGTIKNHQSILFSEIGEQMTLSRVPLSATATSGGEVTFAVGAGPGVISNNVLTFTGTGTVSVVASQAGNDDWCPATTTQTLEVYYPLYMVVDLSNGSSASSYPVSYYIREPSAGFNTDVYKTTKLVLRRIEPGTFKMGGSNTVTLSKAFYIGIFEMTQKQYKQVTGKDSGGWIFRGQVSYTGDKRPVCSSNAQYSVIRGNTNWPVSSAVGANSFMGRMQTRTGLKFDLPTEAQWEYACRAGTTSKFNNGGNTQEDLNLVGRNYRNEFDGKGGYELTTTVGSYLPNNWGLYDMHGNVSERCLDWYAPLQNGVTDPVGPQSGPAQWPTYVGMRVVRGGWYAAQDPVTWCSSSYRYTEWQAGIDGTGFRIACPAE